MANRWFDSIVSDYLDSYKGLIETAPVDDRSVTISFPFHYSADHRIEVTVTQIEKERFVISDMARTLAELRDAGYSLAVSTKKRIEEIAGRSGLRVVQNHFVLECTKKDLGEGLQRFLEAAKTIADVYLVHGRPRPSPENELTKKVRKILTGRKLLFREDDRIPGVLESHSVNFYVPPNGLPGLAVAILPAHNTHLLAEAWGFKSEDIKKANPRTKVGLIYDVAGGQWSDESKRIIIEKSDVAVPGDSLSAFDSRLPELGVVRP
jgi:hypothetical protein